MISTISIPVGNGTWPVNVPDDRLVPITRVPISTSTVAPRELVRIALEEPVGLNAPLRRAITPEDRVCIAVDERLPALPELLAAILDHLVTAQIDPKNVTLLVPTAGPQSWLDELPDEYGDVKVEVHTPGIQDKLAYLATTKAGRRIYLNRTLVESEFSIVLTGRGFDPTFGFAGAEVAVDPGFSDTASQAAHRSELKKGIPANKPNTARAESLETLRLLGSAFLVQVIEGPGDTVGEVIVGLPESSQVGVERQRANWIGSIDAPADLVIAAISGSKDRIGFLELAKAAAAGRRVLAEHGRLVVLTDSAPELDEAGEMLRRVGDPAIVSKKLAKAKIEQPATGTLWAYSAKESHLFVHSEWPEELIEELFATPLNSPQELQRLVDASERVLILPDAHKLLVEIAES